MKVHNYFEIKQYIYMAREIKWANNESERLQNPEWKRRHQGGVKKSNCWNEKKIIAECDAKCKSKGMACRSSDKLSNVTPESSERKCSHQGQQIFCFCFWFCFALLVFVLFQNEEVSLYGSRLKREWKEIGNTKYAG